MPRPPSSLIGIGLRQPHAQALLTQRPALGFVEVHSENFFAEGGSAIQALLEVRAHYPISLHGVGLSLGSASGLDEAHLDRLARLVEQIDPVRVSDHASFARVQPAGPTSPGAVHASDLLPLAFTPASQDALVANIQRVQDRLRRPILIENLSAYMAYEDDQIPEIEFLIQTCQRAGCQLLLDLNNLVVNGLNRARRLHWQDSPGNEPDRERATHQARAEALDFVWSLPPGMVGQIHLAGFRWPAQPDQLVIDDHSQRISPAVWDAYDMALNHLGEVPTLIEWDVDLPPLAVLLDEARLAAEVIAQSRGEPDMDFDE
ncbi:MAG TPA: DUF692 domain-containing protein [Aquabacterium sp.]|uniref:DUF692 domain-containing protein n=1 Tax=Aquabacterium sp. TaxID=1872578 RepID=UPI002E33A0D9|nr:DUF692 domain-containing protein [Aquabacterium sp.]HEX5354623.1 DUF692 domain-containing protein [Aquabacterium sp.]